RAADGSVVSVRGENRECPDADEPRSGCASVPIYPNRRQAGREISRSPRTSALSKRRWHNPARLSSPDLFRASWLCYCPSRYSGNGSERGRDAFARVFAARTGGWLRGHRLAGTAAVVEWHRGDVRHFIARIRFAAAG